MRKGRRSSSKSIIVDYLDELAKYELGKRKTKPRIRRGKRKTRPIFQPPTFTPDPKSPSVDMKEGELVTPRRKWPETHELQIYLKREEVVAERDIPTFEYMMNSIPYLMEEVHTIVHSNNLNSLYPTLRELSWYLRCCPNYQDQIRTIDFLFKSETGYLPHFVKPGSQPVSSVLKHNSFSSAALFAGAWLCDQSYRVFSNIVFEYEDRFILSRRPSKETIDHQTRFKVMIRQEIAESLRKEFESIDLGSLILGVQKELELLGSQSREAQAYKLFMAGNLTDRQVFDRIAAMAKECPELGWSIPRGSTRYQNLRRATERWLTKKGHMEPLPKRQRSQKQTKSTLRKDVRSSTSKERSITGKIKHPR